MNTDKRKRQNIYFMLAMAILAIVCFLRYFEGTINAQDTTVFAFSYKYGFLSKGFMGTLLMLWDNISPVDLMSYKTVYLISSVGTWLLFIALFLLFAVLLKYSSDSAINSQRNLIIFMGIIAFPMYLTDDNFGRLDLYLTIIMIICMVLLITERLTWLIVPLTIVAMLIHQGYVFMNINIVLVLLFYRMLKASGRRKHYYIGLFAVTFIIASVFFLYFELFSHVNGEAIYDDIYAAAQSLSIDGQSVNDSILDHEILGLDIFDEEYWYHHLNYFEFPWFLALFSPYIILFVTYMLGAGKKQETKTDKWIFAAVLLGAATVLPEMILKVDYGRYIFAILFYYVALIASLIAMGEKSYEISLLETEAKVNRLLPAAGILMAYAFIFPPYRAVRISDVINEITYFFYGFH